VPSRTGDGALAIANFFFWNEVTRKLDGFGGGAETGTRGRVRPPE